MKLYYSPGACSLSPHIVAEEAGVALDLEKVDLSTHKTEKGEDFYAVNPKGYVPALKLDNGTVLTEGPAIVQYIADLAPEKKLAPLAGTLERYRLQEWLNYIATEIHKGFGPLFNPKMPEESKIAAKKLIAKRIDFIVENLADKDYLLGKTFTVADAYLFTVLSWSPLLNFDLSPWPVLKTYLDRVAARPAVKSAMKEEGLIKD